MIPRKHKQEEDKYIDDIQSIYMYSAGKWQNGFSVREHKMNLKIKRILGNSKGKKALLDHNDPKSGNVGFNYSIGPKEFFVLTIQELYKELIKKGMVQDLILARKEKPIYDNTSNWIEI